MKLTTNSGAKTFVFFGYYSTWTGTSWAGFEHFVWSKFWSLLSEKFVPKFTRANDLRFKFIGTPPLGISIWTICQPWRPSLLLSRLHR